MPDSIRVIAKAELTEKQFEAWVLWEDDLGYGKIGERLGISTSAARNRVHAAVRNIEVALEKWSPAHSVRESDSAPTKAAA